MTSQTKKIEQAVKASVRCGMILPSEAAAMIASASRELKANGSVYICGETIRMTRTQQDATAANLIRNMSAATFDRYANGL